jgi:D-aminoacyl-tRNA deacylase
MIAVIQRVAEAEVTVAGESVGRIGRGLLALVGVARGDDEAAAMRLLDRMLRYRIFADDAGRMNRDLSQSGGELLLVSQFTLVAETGKGLRPGFSSAAPPDEAGRLFEVVVAEARRRVPRVATGRFGADMQVRLTNDGPVTFILAS